MVNNSSGLPEVACVSGAARFGQQQMVLRLPPAVAPLPPSNLPPPHPHSWLPDVMERGIFFFSCRFGLSHRLSVSREAERPLLSLPLVLSSVCRCLSLCLSLSSLSLCLSLSLSVPVSLLGVCLQLSCDPSGQMKCKF